MLERSRTRVISLLALLLAVAAVASLLVFDDERIRGLLANTLMLAVGSSLIAVPLGTGLAILLFRTDLFGRRLFGIAVVVMLFVPLFLQSAGWDAGFGLQGWFSFSRGLANPLLAGWSAAIWIHGMASIPWVVLLVGTALWFVDAEFEELALLEVSAASVLWRVTLRRCLPAIGVAVIWTQITTAGQIAVTDRYGVRTYAEEIYLTIQLRQWDPMYQQVGSTILVIAALAMLALIAVFHLAPTAPTAPTRGSVRFRLGAGRHLAFVLAAAVVLLMVGLPLANLCVNAGMVVEPVGGTVERSWQFTKFWDIVLPAAVQFSEEFGWTLLIGAVSATAVIAVAIPLAWWARRHVAGAALALTTTAVCLAIPGPLIGLILIGLLNRDSDFFYWLYDRTIFAPTAAAFVRGLPLAILVCWHALRSIAADTLEAAAVEGAGPSQRLWRIAAPQRFGVLAAAWLAAFAVALGDLSATILVAPPGITTLSMRVFGLLHAGVDDQVAGLCLTTFAMFSLTALLTIYASGALSAVRNDDRPRYT